jgi:hypothetical protein
MGMAILRYFTKYELIGQKVGDWPITVFGELTRTGIYSSALTSSQQLDAK